MANSSFPNVCLFVFVVLLQSATFAFSAPSLSPASFTIVNQIETWPATIQGTCRPGNNGNVVVDGGEFVYKENVLKVLSPNFWGKSWYECYFMWGSKSASFGFCVQISEYI